MPALVIACGNSNLTNYSRGRAREYQVMHILRDDGWVCSRSAMSHGPVDVFAAKGGKILLIQVKSGSARVTNVEIDLLKSYAYAFKATAQVWYFKKRGELLKKTIWSASKRNIVKKRPLPLQPVKSSVAIAQIEPQILS